MMYMVSRRKRTKHKAFRRRKNHGLDGSRSRRPGMAASMVSWEKKEKHRKLENKTKKKKKQMKLGQKKGRDSDGLRPKWILCEWVCNTKKTCKWIRWQFKAQFKWDWWGFTTHLLPPSHSKPYSFFQNDNEKVQRDVFLHPFFLLLPCCSSSALRDDPPWSFLCLNKGVCLVNIFTKNGFPKIPVSPLVSVALTARAFATFLEAWVYSTYLSFSSAVSLISTPSFFKVSISIDSFLIFSDHQVAPVIHLEAKPDYYFIFLLLPSFQFLVMNPPPKTLRARSYLISREAMLGRQEGGEHEMLKLCIVLIHGEIKWWLGKINWWLIRLGGFPQDVISSFRGALELLYPWKVDAEAATQKEFTLFLLYSGCEVSPLPSRPQLDGSIVPRNNIEEVIPLHLILTRRLHRSLWNSVLGSIECDPSANDYLSFAQSISGRFKTLARQVEELLQEALDRKEMYYTVALCYYGKDEYMVALDLLRSSGCIKEMHNLMWNLPKGESLLDLQLKDRLANKAAREQKVVTQGHYYTYISLEDKTI